MRPESSTPPTASVGSCSARVNSPTVRTLAFGARQPTSWPSLGADVQLGRVRPVIAMAASMQSRLSSMNSESDTA